LPMPWSRITVTAWAVWVIVVIELALLWASAW
jgi:hypothetical protein